MYTDSVLCMFVEVATYGQQPEIYTLTVHTSNAYSQSCDGVGLHDLPDWLCLHHNHFAEDFPLPSFISWLVADLHRPLTSH